jgi:hypothetical protein
MIATPAGTGRTAAPISRVGAAMFVRRCRLRGGHRGGLDLDLGAARHQRQNLHHRHRRIAKLLAPVSQGTIFM